MPVIIRDKPRTEPAISVSFIFSGLHQLFTSTTSVVHTLSGCFGRYIHNSNFALHPLPNYGLIDKYNRMYTRQFHPFHYYISDCVTLFVVKRHEGKVTERESLPNLYEIKWHLVGISPVVPSDTATSDTRHPTMYSYYHYRSHYRIAYYYYHRPCFHSIPPPLSICSPLLPLFRLTHPYTTHTDISNQGKISIHTK